MTRASYRLALLALAAAALAGSALDVMEVDAAQYASMARGMLDRSDWLMLYHRGADYLDKPPLLFWLSALSFKAFGVANWSYKLPSILFAFLGIHATERFARLHHDAATARRAAIIFGASAAFLLMTGDVRCDALLTGSAITAIWAGTAFVEQRRGWQAALLGLAVAAGMLSKGPMGAMAPALAIGGHVALGRRWEALRDPRWLLALLIAAAALAPMCIGLYEQHGLHGLRFYFWEQSFGRLTGENRWKDDSTALFFTHELPWQVLPWTVPVLLGLAQAVRAVARRTPLPEHASAAGGVLIFVALSFSRFKLPHYLYVALPLFAVMGARAWPAIAEHWARWAHAAVLVVLAMALTALVAWCFPHPLWPLAAAALGAAAAWALRALARGAGAHAFTATIALWVASGLTANGLIYPQLLAYQANAQAGRWVAAHGTPPDRFIAIDAGGTALDFYAGHPVHWVPDVRAALALIAPGTVLYMDDARHAELLALGPHPAEQLRFEDYQVQLLSIDFILPRTRPQALHGRWLVRY